MRSYAHRSEPLSGWKRGLLITLIVLVALILAVMLLGSPIAKAIVNRKLAELPGYKGHVETLSLQLWKAGAKIENFILYERGHEDDLPVVRAKRAALVLSWPALFHGKLGGSAVVENPEIVMVNREVKPKETKEEKEQKKEEKREKAEETKEKVQRWQEILAQSFPMEISNLEVRNGSIRYVDRTREPLIDVGLTSMHMLATGLGNRPDKEDGELPAKVELRGVTTGNGNLILSVQADPLAKQPRFTTDFQLREMDLTALNNFLLAFADADVSRGSFELFLEVNAKDGAYEGYIKPFFKDLDFKTASDKDKSPAQLLKKKVVSAVTSVLKSNDDDKKVATKAPFRGNFADNKVDVWTTIRTLLRNAFLQALREGFEGQPPPK
jgi:hypothetical protein